VEIAIARYEGANPFQDYPQLRSIWPEPYRTLSEEGVTEHLEMVPEHDIGDVVLILKGDRVVGISGYFPMDTGYRNLGLRWHGIIPSERGQGISRVTLSLVATLARKRFPDSIHLIELVPMNDFGKPVMDYFKRIGFRPEGKPERFEWADHDWQPIAMALSDLELKPVPFQQIARP
jgi:RimJ/RimL family protein N-acetyltransferase